MSELPSYRRTRIVRTSFRPSQRILMVSDIHGHDAVFRKLLRKAAFTRDDALVIVGDLLEKGTESLKVIRTLMALKKTYQVYVLLGNMDAFTLHRLLSDEPFWRDLLFDKAPDMIRWWGGCLLEEMCRELGIALNEVTDRVAAVRLLRARSWNLLPVCLRSWIRPLSPSCTVGCPISGSTSWKARSTSRT